MTRTTPTGPAEPTAGVYDVDHAEQDEDGQLALGIPGEQRCIPGLAKRREPGNGEEEEGWPLVL
jgi:hypothetical protein